MTGGQTSAEAGTCDGSDGRTQSWQREGFNMTSSRWVDNFTFWNSSNIPPHVLPPRLINASKPLLGYWHTLQMAHQSEPQRAPAPFVISSSKGSIYERISVTRSWCFRMSPTRSTTIEMKCNDDRFAVSILLGWPMIQKGKRIDMSDMSFKKSRPCSIGWSSAKLALKSNVEHISCSASTLGPIN